jgi:hypothetical protein
MKVFVDKNGKAVYFIHIVSFFWFIQNQSQGWTGSAAGLKEDPDRADLVVLEIIL